MTDTVVVALIGGVATVVATVPSVFVLRSRRETKADIKEVHVLVDGNLKQVKDALETATGEISELRGYIDSKISSRSNVTSVDLVPSPTAAATPPVKP